MQKEQAKKERTLTIGDIAEALQVSKTTVSRAISGKGRIGEETRRKVNEYIKEHNYKPNAIAKGLAQSKTYNMGVVLPADSNLSELPFFYGCLLGINEACAEADYDVVVTTTTEDDITLLERLNENGKVDGVVLTRMLQDDSAIRYLKESGLPFVVIGTTKDNEIVQIDSDHTTCCYEMTSILRNTGCERMALLCGSNKHVVNKMRLAGFQKAAGGLDLIFENLGTKSAIQRALDKAMEQKADCIVCSDDNICNTVIAQLSEKGLRIPEDIRVASFYNSAYLANNNPPISAVNIDVKMLGQMAGRRLLERIAGEQSALRTLIPYEIQLKKSTAWWSHHK